MVNLGPERVARALLGTLLYFPLRTLEHTPADAGLEFRDLEAQTIDGERLHGWWVGAAKTRIGHILFCHGNAGNIADRLINAQLLSQAGFDLLLFDYRGYGRSTGRPDEQGTYCDARAALHALLQRPGVDPARVFYLGESLGAAIALNLALERTPRGLIVQSGFKSIRDVARRHFPVIPPPLVPDAYPSLRRIENLRAPLLVLHGDRDRIVPLSHGEALYARASVQKSMHVFEGRGHNDLASAAEREYVDTIEAWARALAR